jgi:ankyrin repeat protein
MSHYKYQYPYRYQPVRPLVTAVTERNLASAEQLLSQGANPNMKDREARSMLKLASINDDTEMVILLLNYGADPTLDLPDQESLYEPFVKRNNEIVRLLLEKGANPNIKDQYGRSLLRLACINNDTEMVILLLNYGADPKLELSGQSSLCDAINNRNIEIVRLLLEKGANPNRECGLNKNLLFQAIIIGDLDILDLLLQYGANSYIKIYGQNAYDVAEQWRRFEAIEHMKSYE